ncbi:MAG: type and secretion system protein, partial [Edaphobacter sp.]|nr:type and secretion system protein [Edaphobacter sp.]
MVYSPERNSLAGTAPTGSVLPICNTGAGVYSGKRHTLHAVKDANGSSMGRGNNLISTSSTCAVRALALLLFVCCLAGATSVAAHAQSANTWNKRGQDAETRQDYDAAYEAYRQAILKNPKDLRFKAHYERMKFQAAVGHLDRGRVLKQSGDLTGALNEFTRALQIDPSNQAAQQEIDILWGQQPPGAAGSTPPPLPPSGRDDTLKNIGSISGPVELKPVSNDPITLHMVEDVKNIYQAIGKAAGLNVLFDPDYTSKRIPVDLTNVTLFDALRIVGT